MKRSRYVTITRPDDTEGLDASWGHDRLTVNGDARYKFHSRTLMMSGQVTRTWSGGVMRLASMEGVVCGGVMTRVIAGPSLALSGMRTGDVYGAIARASAVRAHIAVLQYRAAQSAAWAIGVWVRRTTFTIVPVVPAPPQVKPASNAAASKMGRLMRTARKAGKAVGRAVRVTRMVCPVVDILLGVLALPFALYGLVMLMKSFLSYLKGLASTKNVIPPVGPPRLLSSNSAMTAEMYMSKQFT